LAGFGDSSCFTTSVTPPRWASQRQSDYQKIIEAIRRLAEGQGVSIAMWELSIYSRR